MGERETRRFASLESYYARKPEHLFKLLCVLSAAERSDRVVTTKHFEAGLALLKPGLHSLFELIPEETCVAIYRRIRWLGKLCCLWLPGSESQRPPLSRALVSLLVPDAQPEERGIR